MQLRPEALLQKMVRIFPYLTAGYFTLATALNAFAADPAKVKSIENYVISNGRVEAISLGPYNDGEGRAFEWPLALRGQKGELVDSFNVTVQVITTADAKVLLITQSRYDRNDGRFWYVTMGDGARGQELDGILNFAETGIMIQNSTNQKENRAEYHSIDPAEKEEWASAVSTFDRLVEILYHIIPK